MKTRMTVPELDITVLNPVLVQVLNDIGHRFGITEEIYISIDNEFDVKKSTGANRRLGEKGIQSLKGVNDNLNCAMIITSYKKSFVEGFNNSVSVVSPSSHPIFKDEEIGFVAKPIYYKEKIELGIDLLHNSKTYLSTLISRLKSIANMPGLIFKHNPEFTYTLPHNLKALLYNIYNCKKTLEPNLQFLDYFNTVASSNVTYRTSETDNSINNLSLAVKERQLECIGYVPEDILDTEIEVDDENAGYKISFQYEFELMVPNLLYLEYPILVYNQMLHKDLLKQNSHYDRPLHTNTLSADEGFYKLFSPGTGPYTYNIESYFRSPKEDDFLPEKLPDRYSRIFSVLIVVDPHDPYTIMSLEDPDIPFRQPVLKFIKESERDYIGLMDRSLIHFRLYEYDQPSKNPVYLDVNYTLKVKEPLDMKKIYRLTGYILKDLNFLSSEDRTRIQEFINSDYLENFRLFQTTLDKQGKELYSNTLKMTTQQYQNYLVEIADIRNQFLSTLDMFIDYYNLDQNEVQEIMHKYQDPFTVLVQLTDSNPRHAKIKQTSYITLFNKG